MPLKFVKRYTDSEGAYFLSFILFLLFNFIMQLSVTNLVAVNSCFNQIF